MSETIQQVQQAFTAYTIERELGAGGMATVYLAHDKKHDRMPHLQSGFLVSALHSTAESMKWTGAVTSPPV